MMRVLLRGSIVILLLSFACTFAACHKAVATQPVAAPPSPPPPAPSITLNSDRTTITAGQPVTLTWQSANATTVTIDNAIGNVAVSGSRQVSPQTSTSFTATARGEGGTAVSAAVRITVNLAAVPTATPQPASRPASPVVQPVRTPTLA